ncbi:sugar transferase [Candidatus Dependentiae bacterium]|nr:sugar transferase [Candidatus Dependentiae bacterium]
MILTNNYDESQYIYKDRPVYDFFKRFLDLFIAIILLFLLSPVFLIIIVILKISYKQNVFYFQERVGQHGKIFKIYKFRTMKLNAEDIEPVWAKPDDERCTVFGKILRKTSIDELPQLINIIAGNLSIVGPRPERPFFMKDHVGLSGKRLLVKPGLTGLAQVNGRYKLNIEEKLKFDLEYIHNRSVYLDIKIMIKTVPVIISCNGAW